jgi:Gp49-like protein DUF891
MDLDILPEAEAELVALRRRDPAEHKAMLIALGKLAILGLGLPPPHVRHVDGTDLWELRPRQGRSRWRALFRRDGNQLRVATIGPEAQVDPRGFRAAIRRALGRLG